VLSADIAFLHVPAAWAVRKSGMRRSSADCRPDASHRDVAVQLDAPCGLPPTKPSCVPVDRRCDSAKHARFLDDATLLGGAIAAHPCAESGRKTCSMKTHDLFAVDRFERIGLRATEVVQCRMSHVRIESGP
jgi:hypothetical protein